MQKTTSKKLSKRLLQYGVMSAAALCASQANAQIVYTDVDPDENLMVGDEFIADITNGGTEFNISNPSGLAGGNAALIFPSSGGAFVGLTAYGFEYPGLLNAGDVIDGAAGFTNTGARGDLNYYGCAYSNSQWCGTVVDGYLGISFQFSGNTHYGWIRLDTDVNGTNIMTVKDYAYNSTPNEAIEAGQQALSIDDFNLNDTRIVALNKSVGLYNLSGNSTNYNLYDITGKVVLNGTTSDNSHVIEAATLSSGIYIVELRDSNSSSVLRKKVVL